MRKRIVISAVNLVEGGTYKILVDCLQSAVRELGESWDIIALVHRKELVPVDGVQVMEFPNVKSSWLSRMRLEFHGFKALSATLNPDLWLSLHDISPIVSARRQAVYCHNPSPFYHMPLRRAHMDWKLFLFTKFYGFLYGLNISSNDFVIVQQEWLRRAFQARYHPRSIVVAHPVGEEQLSPLAERQPDQPSLPSSRTILLYPTLPRVFKNVEILCEAIALLPDDLRKRVELRLTIRGDENAYASWLKKRFGDMPEVSFMGRLNRSAMSQAYREADVVVFPSRLETWGLPISEAKAAGLPLLVSDLPYAHETIGSYDKVAFLSPDTASSWTDAISRLLNETDPFVPHAGLVIEAPFARDWNSLWTILTDGL